MALIWRGDKVSATIHKTARARVIKAAILFTGIVKASMILGGRTASLLL